MNPSMLKSDKQDWGTPPELFEKINRKYGPFDLDVCALPNTAKCENFYSLVNLTDGLKESWKGRCFCNPPYNDLLRWVKKAFEELKAGNCERVAFLITARPDTIAWQDFVFPYATYINFLRGRLKFINPETMLASKDPAMFPSAVVVFDYPLTFKPTLLLF